MFVTPMVVFGVSLVGIILLFVLKRVEIRRGSRFGEPLRMHADAGALAIKSWIEVGERYLERTPWFVAALSRYGVRIGALAFARLARRLAEDAHRLADFVSHKHRFERRETKSQFLKEVSEHKNGANGHTDEVASR